MLLNFDRILSGFRFPQNAAIFTSSIFHDISLPCKFESSRYGVSSTIQISSKFKFNPHLFLQPSLRSPDGSTVCTRTIVLQNSDTFRQEITEFMREPEPGAIIIFSLPRLGEFLLLAKIFHWLGLRKEVIENKNC